MPPEIADQLSKLVKQQGKLMVTNVRTGFAAIAPIDDWGPNPNSCGSGKEGENPKDVIVDLSPALYSYLETGTPRKTYYGKWPVVGPDFIVTVVAPDTPIGPIQSPDEPLVAEAKSSSH